VHGFGAFSSDFRALLTEILPHNSIPKNILSFVEQPLDIEPTSLHSSGLNSVFSIIQGADKPRVNANRSTSFMPKSVSPRPTYPHDSLRPLNKETPLENSCLNFDKGKENSKTKIDVTQK